MRAMLMIIAIAFVGCSNPTAPAVNELGDPPPPVVDPRSRPYDGRPIDTEVNIDTIYRAT